LRERQPILLLHANFGGRQNAQDDGEQPRPSVAMPAPIHRNGLGDEIDGSHLAPVVMPTWRRIDALFVEPRILVPVEIVKQRIYFGSTATHSSALPLGTLIGPAAHR
jgi:hypothetical protein